MAAVLAAATAPSSHAVTVGSTTVLGPWVGLQAPLHPANQSPMIQFYGTDLGFSYKHGNELKILFGDSVGNGNDACPIAAWSINPFCVDNWDDAFGSVDLTVYSNPSTFGTTIPRVKLAQESGGNQAWPLMNEKPMDAFKTPEGGFSNGTNEFAVFIMGKPLACQTTSECTAVNSALSCDTSLGWWDSPPWNDHGWTGGCADSQSGCNANTKVNSSGTQIPNTGYCVDTNSSTYSSSSTSGKLAGAAFKMRAGIRSTTDARRYTTTEFATNRFYNQSLATVQSFVPANGSGYANQNYNVATSTGTNRRVLVWGRPGFFGINALSRPAKLYFGYRTMPTGTSAPSWQLNYYTGTVNGVPQFSTNEANAAPLDLNAAVAGVQSGEPYDAVGQMSVVWVDQLKKWVMFYGGGLSKLPTTKFPNCGIVEALTGADCTSVNMGNGAIKMRTANDPWGPWTEGVDVLVGGNPNATPLQGQYQAGGILRHPSCTASNCAPHSNMPIYSSQEYGALYAPVIHQPWITGSATTGVDLIWSVSTWDPYRVVLLRTHLNP